MSTPSDAAEAAPVKTIFASKTAAVQAVVAVAAFIPSVQAFVAENPALVLTGIALLNLGVRFITKGRVTIFRE